MKQIRTRLTYANVMSSLAVFLVLGGATAIAAGQLANNSVGSNQLKKNAVTTAKIKNGAVTVEKIAASAQAALKGAQGPTGPQGAAAAQSAGGGAAVGVASSVKGGLVEIGRSKDKQVVIDSLDLGPGKWMLVAQTGLVNTFQFELSAWCSLNAGGAELGRTRVWDHEAVPNPMSGEATVLGAVDLPAGGAVEFRCWAEKPSEATEAAREGKFVFTTGDSRPAMQAIQVETLVTG